MALINPVSIMIAIPSFQRAQHLVTHSPDALPLLPCAHARLSIGLDQAYCPDCCREFKPRTPEYKSAMLPEAACPLVAVPEELPTATIRSCPGERDNHHSQPDLSVPQNTSSPGERRDSRHTPANGWIEKYLSKGRWEYHRYCWRLGRKGKTNKRHIPSDSGKLLAVRNAIASGKSPLEIEQLIKSWKATNDPQ